MARTHFYLVFCLLFFLQPVFLIGQQFYRTYDYEYIYNLEDVTADENGNHLLLGYAHSPPAGGDLVAICTDSQGDTAWVKAYGGHSTDYVYAACPIAGGGWAVLGTSWSFGTSETLWVTRLDVNGNVLWSRICTQGYDFGIKTSWSIKESPSGDLWMVSNIFTNFSDALVIRMDAGGTVQWMRSIGGAAGEFLQGLTLTQDGGGVCAGVTASFGNTNNNFYAFKFDSTGNLAWTRVIYASSKDAFYGITEAPNADLICVGKTPDSSSGTAVVLVRMDASGNVKWSHKYRYMIGGTTVGQDVEMLGEDIVVGGYHLGTSGKLPALMVFDSLGLPKTSKLHFSPEEEDMVAMEKSGDSLFAFAGTYKNGVGVQKRVFLWVTDTTSSVSMCEDFGRTLTMDTLMLVPFTGGNPQTLTYDSAVQIMPLTREVEVDLHCNDWGACNLEASFYEYYSQNGQLCQFDSIPLFENGYGASTYSWYWDGVLFSTALDPYFYPTDTGFVEIMLVAENTGGACSDTFVKTYEILPVPDPHIQVDGGPEFCAGDTVWLEVTGVTGSAVWLPYPQQGFRSYSVWPGDFYAQVTGANGCRVNSDTITLTRLPAPFANFSHQVSGLSVQFTDLSPGAVGWYWDFGDNGSSNQQNPSHTYAAPGIYTARLFITDSSGCEGTRFATIRLEDPTGLEAPETPQVKVFPVPAENRLWVEAGEVVEIAVLDVLGREVAVPIQRESRSRWEINTQGLSAGTWLLEVTTRQGKEIRKVMILRD